MPPESALLVGGVAVSNVGTFCATQGKCTHRKATERRRIAVIGSSAAHWWSFSTARDHTLLVIAEGEHPQIPPPEAFKQAFARPAGPGFP